MNKKSFVTFALLLLLSFSIGYCFRNIVVLRHGVTKAEANLWVFAEKVDASYSIFAGNVITDIGENLTRIRHSRNQSATDYALYWISIGNVTAGTAKTQLDTEYARFKGTLTEWTNAGDYALNCSYTHTFNETKTTNGAGIHWDLSGDGNLYACANHASTEWNNNDNATYVWSITFNAN